VNRLVFKSPIGAPAETVFDWHARPGAFERLTPPWAPVRLEHFEGIEDGDRAVLSLGYGPASIRWVAEHYGYEAGRQFCDRQLSGPFRRWTHEHRFTPRTDDEDGSMLVDALEYEVPFAGLGEAVDSLFGENELRRQFAYRHRVTQQDVAMHRRYQSGERSLTVAVSGASGLIGRQLTALLTTGGHTVRRLVRQPPTSEDEILWQPRAGAIEADKLEEVDAVIHLAGENIFALRWTAQKKQRIYGSRADGTRLLAETLAELDDPPEVFLSASAIGYYGDHGTEPVTEESRPRGTSFLREVCEAWEDATTPAAEAGIRTAQLRTGIVLTPAGGALQLMQPVFQLGLGGRIGGRDQYFPWITLDDVLGGYYHALMDDTVEGPVNLTAPNPVTMDELADTLGTVLSRPTLLSVPGSAARLALGEVADELLLQSARVLPERLQESGYAFRHPELEGGLRHVLGRTLAPHRPLAYA
jgi:hypothetical protein